MIVLKYHYRLLSSYLFYSTYPVQAMHEPILAVLRQEDSPWYGQQSVIFQSQK